MRCLCSTGRVGSSPITRTTFLFRLWEKNFGYARVVELADSLDSGSSAHYGRAGSSPASRTTSFPQKLHPCARVVELADSLDSGSSAHYGRAGSSPASRTKSDTNFDTMGIRLVSDFFAPWGGRFCMSRHSVFSHAVRWRSARDPGFHFFNQESRVRKVLETRRVRSRRKQKRSPETLRFQDFFVS